MRPCCLKFAWSLRKKSFPSGDVQISCSVHVVKEKMSPVHPLFLLFIFLTLLLIIHDVILYWPFKRTPLCELIMTNVDTQLFLGFNCLVVCQSSSGRQAWCKACCWCGLQVCRAPEEAARVLLPWCHFSEAPFCPREKHWKPGTVQCTAGQGPQLSHSK